jgi:hypothetical protein
MGSMCRPPARCGCASCSDVPSAGSPVPFSRGWPRTLRPRGNGPSCASGTMPPGTSASWCRSGSSPTIATPNRRGAVASSSVGYRARIPASIRLSPSGCMGNGLWWNPRVCSPRLNSCSASVPTITVN